MKSRLFEWLRGLAPNERRLVIAGAAVAGAALFFLAVWEPLDRAVTEMRDRVERERALAAWIAGVRAEAEDLQDRQPRTPVRGRDESLLSLVDRTVRAAGLGGAMRRIQPENENRAAVTFEDVGFNALLFWLRDLERDYGVRPAALTVDRGGEPGTVSARMTLARDGA